MSKDASKGIVKKNYSKEEKARIAKYEKRSQKKPAKFINEGKVSGKHKIVKEITDRKLHETKMMESLGTSDVDLQTYLLNQVIRTFDCYSSPEEADGNEIAEAFNNALVLLQGIGPKDEIEGMLAIQMVGVHNLAMSAMAQAMVKNQSFQWAQVNMNYSAKLLRIFADQMEALKKYRTGGQQKMTVEHVHVNEGGQAIVGNVNTTGGKGGNSEEDQ